MNDTNRALNRLFLLLVGVLLVAAGALAVAVAVVPAARSAWTSAASGLADRAPAWVAVPVAGTATPLVLGIAALCLVLVVLLIAFIVRQGHGRTAAALRTRDGATSTRIDLAVPRALLEQHLGSREELVSVRISAYEVRGTPMLKITARCRRGISPAVVSALIGDSIGTLERIVGADVPAFVQLTGGFRAGSVSRPQVA